MRVHPSIWCASIVLCLAPAGCGDASASEGDEESGGEETGEETGDDGALPDLDEWCTDESTPTFTTIHRTLEVSDMGPCGHMLSWTEDDQGPSDWVLLYPDGSIEEAIGGSYWASFSRSGRLLATPAADGMVLTDLETRASQVIVAQFPRSGFVRSADLEHPERLWVCDRSADTLQIVGDEVESLATSVECRAVASSLGSPRLVFGRGDVVTVADADSGETWSTSITDFDVPGTWLHEDELSISHDGKLAAHHVNEQVYDDADFTERLETRIVELDGGELLETCEHGGLIQAPTRLAPAFVYCDEQVQVFRAGALRPVDHGPLAASVSLLSDGSLLLATEADDQIDLRHTLSEDPSATVSLASLAGEYAIIEVGKSPDLAYVVIGTSECAVEACNKTVQTLYRWTAAAGISAPLLTFTSPYAAEIFDDGALLLRASPLAGPLPVPTAEPRLLLIDTDDQITEWNVDGYVDAWALSDGRALVQTADGPELDMYMLIFDRSSPTPELLIGPAVPLWPDVDARRERLALRVRQADRSMTLYWGAIP